MRIEAGYQNYPLTQVQAKEFASQTTWKTHALIVLSNVLLAIGIALSAATLFIATVIDPMIAVATPVVPLALGILGLRSAFGENAAIASQPLEKNRPLGMENEGGNDCWLNSAFQVLCNIPSYRKRIESLCNHAKTSEEWLNYNAINSAVDTYVKESKESGKNASTLNSYELRGMFAKIKKEISEKGSEQKDPIIIFEAIHSILKDHLQVKQIYTTPNGPSETDPSGLNFFLLCMHPGENNSFHKLFNEFFEDPPTKKWLKKAPEDFLVYNPRMHLEGGNDDSTKIGDNWSEEKASKIDQTLDIPLNFRFTKKQCPSEQPEYHVDAFINHVSRKVGSGHYIAYIHKEGKWWELNDKDTKLISDFKIKEKLSESTIIHYTKKL